MFGWGTRVSEADRPSWRRWCSRVDSGRRADVVDVTAAEHLRFLLACCCTPGPRDAWVPPTTGAGPKALAEVSGCWCCSLDGLAGGVGGGLRELRADAGLYGRLRGSAALTIGLVTLAGAPWFGGMIIWPALLWAPRCRRRMLHGARALCHPAAGQDPCRCLTGERAQHGTPHRSSVAIAGARTARA